MLIEDVDALKSWLAKLLEPICDADPSALANYVVALVKKDKPEKELKAFCADQLDVFLQKETSGFVDKLFESLYTKNYLPPLEPVKPEPKPLVQEKEEIKEEVFQEPAEEERDGRKKKYPSPRRLVQNLVKEGHVRKRGKMANGETMTGTMSGTSCTERSTTGEEAGARAEVKAEA